MRDIGRQASRERGQALVEFALVLVVFVFLLLGLFDIGRAVWNYNTLSQATREGGRYAIVHGAHSSDPSGPGSEHFTSPNEDSKVEETVMRFAAGLNRDLLTVEAEWQDGTNENGNRVNVRSQYTYDPMFAPLGLVSFTMTSSTTMTIKY